MDWLKTTPIVTVLLAVAFAAAPLVIDPAKTWGDRYNRAIEDARALLLRNPRLAVDAEGFLWIAMFGAGEVRRYAPDGRLDRTIVVPASQPTCCAFGGPEHADLYITTARIGLGAAQLAREPHAGGIFRIRPNVAGLPAHRYRG